MGKFFNEKLKNRNLLPKSLEAERLAFRKAQVEPESNIIAAVETPITVDEKDAIQMRRDKLARDRELVRQNRLVRENGST